MKDIKEKDKRQKIPKNTNLRFDCFSRILENASIFGINDGTNDERKNRKQNVKE